MTLQNLIMFLVTVTWVVNVHIQNHVDYIKIYAIYRYVTSTTSKYMLFINMSRLSSTCLPRCMGQIWNIQPFMDAVNGIFVTVSTCPTCSRRDCHVTIVIYGIFDIEVFVYL
jgi:hypothetical protein